jgi:hypothetical protein
MEVIMRITNNKLKEQFLSTFPIKYKRFSNFVNSGFLWDRIMLVVESQEYMNNIIFCNDIMGIPPVKTFLSINKFTIITELANEEKQSIGAVFGCIFKDVFGYTEQESVSCTINSVKTATRFLSSKEKMYIIEESEIND